MKHKANVLSKSEVEQNRSNAYQYLNFNTMNAEEFYKEYWRSDYFHPKNIHNKLIPKIDYYGVIEFAEAYHKAKINSITDEEIDKQQKEYELRNGILHAVSFGRGAEWFKNKLLNK